LAKSWDVSARQFLGHIDRVLLDKSRKPHAA
jgi:hypothetical protein